MINPEIVKNIVEVFSTKLFEYFGEETKSVVDVAPAVVKGTGKSPNKKTIVWYVNVYGIKNTEKYLEKLKDISEVSIHNIVIVPVMSEASRMEILP